MHLIMTRTKTILIALVAVLAIAAVPFLYAQGARMHGHGDHGGQDGGFGGGMLFRHLSKLQSELNLTDAQVAQIKQIADDTKTQNAPYRDQLKGGFAAVAKTLIANPNDTAAAQAILDQQSVAKRAVQTNILAAASKALNVLTPEQRTKLGTLLDEHLAHMTGHH
jgi:Spy/CpxP family protein refolding chaperone